MTIKNLALAAAALCALSCTDFDNGFTETDAYKNHLIGETLDEYTANFEARFGKIDPNHNWGFGPIDVPVTRGEIINKNEWEEVYHLQVPGWPDYYYCKDDKTRHNNGYHDANDVYTDLKNTTVEPGGDVTDEEIQYVSWWFRTHRYPTSLPVHWADFYIQEVCSDNDRKADGTVDKDFTLFTYNDSKQCWEKSIQQYDMTMDYLGVKTQDDPDNFVHLEKFNGTRQNKLHSIDRLPMEVNNVSTIFNDDVTVSGESKKMSDLTNTRLIDFYTCMSTEDFMCHNSVDNTERSNYKFEHNEEATPIWVLVHLHFIGKSGRIYDNYYLGFDFAAFKNNGSSYEMREPDGYYSNWIVKLSPAIPQSVNNQFTRRIMCEDLGNTLDLDFDDIVFDATINSESAVYNSDGKVDISINLMAAGGTMPVWVGKDPNGDLNNKYEMHKMFHHDVKTPVNVEKGGKSPIVNYHVTLTKPTDATDNRFDFDDIPIWVYNTKEKIWITIPKVKNLNCRYEEHTVGAEKDENDEFIYNKNKDTRYAPQKFAVPVSVLWLKETNQIELGYPHFGDWAHDHTQYPIFEFTEGHWNNGNDYSNAWYNVSKNSQYLCGQGGETNYNNNPTPGQLADNGYAGTTSTCWNENTYDVNVYTNNAEWGSVTVTGGDVVNSVPFMFKAGSTATVKANCIGNNSRFLGWRDGNQTGDNYLSTDATYTFTVNKRNVIMAVFDGDKNANQRYKVTYSGVGCNVRITNRNTSDTNSSSDETEDKYYRVRLTFAYDNVDAGKQFIGWFVNGEYQNENTNFEYFVEGPTNVVAKFGEAYTMPIYVHVLNADGTEVDNPTASGNVITLNYSSRYGDWTGDNDDKFSTIVGKTINYKVTVENGYDVIWGDSQAHPNEGSFEVYKGMFLDVTFKKRDDPQVPEESKRRTIRKK